MTKCKLCKDKDLDNTGAHFFSDALIRSGLYVEGKFKRGDYEAIGEISRNKVGFTYFGPSVIPEKRAELLGRPQTEEEIAETSEHVFINRELVCRQCEKKFNPVETYFVAQVYQKILDSDKCENGKFEFDEYLHWVTFLMFLINIWRASASKFNDWQIKPEDEEIIRIYLNKVLVGSEIEEIVSAAKKYKEEVSKYKFQLLVTEQTKGKLTENLILADHTDNPYMIYLNRLIILFSDNGFSEFEIPELLKPYISKEQIELSQMDESKLIVFQLNNEQRNQLNKSIIQREWEQWVKETEEKLSMIIRKAFGRDITEEELNFFKYIWTRKLGNGEPMSLQLLHESIYITFQRTVSGNHN